METVAVAFTILGATCAVITAIEGTRNLRRDYRAKRDGIAVLEAESSQLRFIEAAKTLSHTVNDVSSTLGRNLPWELDAKLQDDIRALQPEIKALLKSIESQKSAQKRSDGKQAEVPILSLEDRAMELKKRLQKAVDDFRSRLRKKKLNKVTAAPAPSGTKFCYGATLCQNGKATAASLAISNTSNFEKPEWGFICQYCNLEVGDYKTILLSSTGTALETSDLMASCHVMACDGQNLRAYYKCLVCYLDRKDNAFSTASDLEAHMMEHPALPLVLERPISASARAAQRDIEKFLEHELPEPVLPDAGLDNPESSLVGHEEAVGFDIHSIDNTNGDAGSVSPLESPADYNTESRTQISGESGPVWVTEPRPRRPRPPIPQTYTLVNRAPDYSPPEIPELDTGSSKNDIPKMGDSLERTPLRVELPAPETLHPGGSDVSLALTSHSQDTAVSTPPILTSNPEPPFLENTPKSTSFLPDSIAAPQDPTENPKETRSLLDRLNKFTKHSVVPRD
ncbi:hypothetical protein FDECE_1112 [Fusarium decemcellulare]|nr:hypothetical protein FDECE_1112 [Fusarium decemcellulare]